MKIWKRSFFLTVSISISMLSLSAAQAQNSNGNVTGPYSGWTPTSQSPAAAGMGVYGTPDYRGGARFLFSGSYFTPYGRPLVFNPLTPFVWGVNNKPPGLGENWFVGRVNGGNIYYWRGSAGYYYPWLNGGGIVTYISPGGVPITIGAPIIFWGGGGSEPISQLPPPAIQLADAAKFLEDSFKDKKVLEARYKHLKQRTSDLQKKERSLRIAQGGELDKDGEAEIRHDLESLTKEMNASVKS